MFRNTDLFSLVFCFGVLLRGAAAGEDKPPTADAARPASPSAEQSPDSASEPLHSAKLRFFRNRLQKTRIVFPDQPEAPLRLVAEPVSRFDNPVSGIADGFAFLWTDRGRPAVLLKSYYNAPRESWGRTYVSLAARPLELLVEDDHKPWTPPASGISFQPLESAERPADSARARLRQMREIARQFEVIDNWGLKDPTDWQLRLLTAPLYRYEIPEEKVVDGALFAYVLTTSPEALLLVEARETAAGLEWSYAASRATRFAITFSHRGKKVAEFPRLDAWPSTGVYFHLPLPMADYPFKTGAK